MDTGQRVVEAMAAGIEGDIAKGMSFICPAIEATVRKTLKKSKVSASEYKDFVRENYWVIEPFIGSGMNFEETVFPEITLKTDNGRIIPKPDFADLVYNVFRCSLMHGHEISEEFTFTKSETQGSSVWAISLEDGHIHMPDKVLWALVACVVFNKVNHDIVTKTSLHLSWGGAPVERDPPYRFELDVFWGGESVVRRFLSKREILRVAMKLAK
ncbi:hypothetical protein SAMN05444358_10550 [Ruegeria halocynthiae]|uniref:Uncharacterized protein n=1 Tax=Ruegeria halocynthiae TaxID=985054 RepID=A0A1H3B4D8_9RHOB|nr:hypothetical protein [Ruegeria halocynthiae]SDX36807.1 hypothetical protein SAMN05444358_10550 [Ruegeria halocynthiae]